MTKLQTHKIKPVYQSVILIGFIFLLFFLSINILKKSTNTSYPILVIVGKSMEPTLYAGDLVLITSVKINELKINQDIIVYHNPGNYDELIIHRVIERLDDNNQTIIRTQGDNVSTPDRWNLTENYIEGKVIFVIPKIGLITNIIFYPFNYVLIGLLIVLILFSDSKKHEQTK
tara:strand:+ start:557 stop:1075 length:519 start_codon:yes stop_codon:yes gene_type:complete